MTPIENIRKNVFGESSQVAFGEIVGVSQGTVSRWEQGEFMPDGENMARIRSAARDRGLNWDDRWFFEAPESASS